MSEPVAWPECEEFYNLMQAYRHALTTDQTAAAYVAVKEWLRAEIERLTQQRDELLAALKDLVAEAKPETSKTEWRQNLAEDCTDLLLVETFSDAVINARAAIDKAES